MAWDPKQYAVFSDQRLRPALELLARIPVETPGSVVDLGCGSGNVTQHLRSRWPNAQLTGIDSSETMLAEAQKLAAAVRWSRADLSTWTSPSPVDVLYSNAALHWIADHGRLLPHLMQQLSSGGVLAVQMPRNFDRPSHRAIQETVLEGPWRAKLEPLWRDTPVANPAAYYDWLAPAARSIDLWETDYTQVLTGRDPVVNWTKGTWLRPFLDALEGEARQQFEHAYATKVAAAYPLRADGTTLFPFRRLFIVAQRR